VETRPYRSQRRASAAAETRRFVLEAALAAFGEHGYVKATIAGIAARADVAVNTVYASVGGKPQLLVALIEDAADSAFDGGADLAASEPRTADEVFQRLEQVAAKRLAPQRGLQHRRHGPGHPPGTAGSGGPVRRGHRGCRPADLRARRAAAGSRRRRRRRRALVLPRLPTLEGAPRPRMEHRPGAHVADRAGGRCDPPPGPAGLTTREQAADSRLRRPGREEPPGLVASSAPPSRGRASAGPRKLRCGPRGGIRTGDADGLRGAPGAG
jgi:AcrR family transcriptional regulator